FDGWVTGSGWGVRFRARRSMMRSVERARKGGPVLRLAAIIMALLPHALSAQPAPRAGDVHEIRVERNMEETSSDGSSGSSHDLDTMIERVIALRDDGVELEFDLPAEATREERAAVWQL